MSESIPIASLKPSTSPPADKFIRAVVSLLWPYSSSTRQCALLLAEPDFRLRNRKGQIRVRFKGPSATAVAKGKVGIGDELLLELRGAAWAVEGSEDVVHTPGKSVDGDLVMKGELGLRIVKKAGREERVDERITVDRSAQSLEEEEQVQEQNGATNMATPVRALPSYQRNNLGSADVVPIYSSPAFVRRMRLSGEGLMKRSSLWDPYADVEEELEQQPKKKQRVSFGNVGRWRLAARTPSPDIETSETGQLDGDKIRSVLETIQTARKDSEVDEANLGPINDQVRAAAMDMPPPSLPRLQMPDQQYSLNSKRTTATADGGPTTPKLQPVPSSALPLPSPFPTDTPQLQLGHPDVTFAASSSTGSAGAQARVLSSDKQAVASERRGNPVLEQTVSKMFQNAADNNKAASQEIYDMQSAVGLHDSLTPTFTQIRGDTSKQGTGTDSHDDQQLGQTQVEYLSDTEEDEEMYYEHMRRRFPSVTDDGLVRVDHQHEGYYDDMSIVDEDDVEEVIGPEGMGEAPEDNDSGDEAGDGDDGNDVHDRVATEPKGVPRQDPQKEINNAGSVIGDEPPLKAGVQAPESPTVPSQSLFGTRTVSNMPSTFRPTGKSDQERIMAKTYSSLFGFKASPSPERRYHQPQPHMMPVDTPAPVVPTPVARAIPSHVSFTGSSVIRKNGAAMQAFPDGRSQGDASIEARQRPVGVIPQRDPEVEPAPISTEIVNSTQVEHIDDGTLLEAVMADKVAQEATERSAKTAADGGTAIENAAASTAQLVDEDIPVSEAQREESPLLASDEPVPEGIAMNEELGAAIAPSLQQTAQLPDSGSMSSQAAEVIELGSSNDEPKMKTSPIQQAEQTQRPAQSPYQPVNHLQLLTNQDSQGSALQSDMLDRTQTTVERSEIATPIASNDFFTAPETVPDEEIPWHGTGHQSFFADQMHETEAPAFQPPLIQQATGSFGEAHYNFSFQSATSVATDNSESGHPPTHESFMNAEDMAQGGMSFPQAAQRSSLFEERAEPIGVVEIISSSPAAEEAEQIAMDVQDILASEDHVMGDGDAATRPRLEHLHNGQPSHDANMNLREAEKFSTVGSFTQYAQHPDGMFDEIDRVHVHPARDVEVIEDLAEEEGTMVRRSHEEPGVIDRQLDHSRQPASERPSYPALPISPGDSQSQSQYHIASQPLETQIQAKLPLTPQLTQGDSSVQEVQVIVEPAPEEAVPDEPATRRRTRRSRSSTVDETLYATPQKGSVRRSPRSSRANNQISEEPEEEEEAQAVEDSTRAKPVTARHPGKLKEPSADVRSFDSQNETPVRRSTRLSHSTTEIFEELDERSQPVKVDPVDPEHIVAEATTPKPEPTIDAREDSKPLHSPLPKEPSSRRSQRKSRTESQVSSSAIMDAEEEGTMRGQGTDHTLESIQEASSGKEVEMAKPNSPTTKTPAKKSFTARIVPEAISNWFSPRRSTRHEGRKDEADNEDPTDMNKKVELKPRESVGIATSLSYFTPLSNLEQKLNPTNRSFRGNLVEVLAIVTEATTNPERAKTGPRDYFTSFRITDPNLADNTSIRVEIFRPWHAVLPVAHVGDAVLLRDFAVKSRKRQPYLISSDSSAWCVWRYDDAEDEEGDDKAKPAHALRRRPRGASFSGIKEEIKGPPVEMGDEERRRAEELRSWWQGLAASGE